MSYMKYCVLIVNGFHFMYVLHVVERAAMVHVCVCMCVCVCVWFVCGVYGCVWVCDIL